MTSAMASPWLDDGDVQLYHGDALAVLADGLPSGSVQTCVTSPPYWGLRDYGTGEWAGGRIDCDHLVRENGADTSRSTLGGGTKTTGHQREGFREACPRCGARRVDQQIGLESSPDEYVRTIVNIFREVWRVLRDDGTLWLNLGDSYNAYNGGAGPGSILSKRQSSERPDLPTGYGLRFKGLKPKDLVGIPWRVAFALQADGWYLRSDIIWAKPNPMPESVTDRPTKAHEYVFLLSKGLRYFYDADAISEAANPAYASRYDSAFGGAAAEGGRQPSANGIDMRTRPIGAREFTGKRNARSVWDIATQPTPEAHFATYPEELVRRCILAGSREGDTVLDPFVGSGTAALVARKHGRRAVGIDLNASYLQIAARRLSQLSLFADSGGGVAV